MGFAILQFACAFIAQSEAMLGDSVAMAVDSIGYGFNLYAEREKNQDSIEDQSFVNENDEKIEDNIELATAKNNNSYDENAKKTERERERVMQQLLRRRRHLHLELVPPLTSVSILIIVTALVLRGSIQTLILDTHRDQSEQTSPNLKLMIASSTANLLLDILNVTCFARAKHLMGYKTNDESRVAEQYGEVVDDVLESYVDGDDFQSEATYEEEEEEEEEERINLNMCSAYTHVFADTLRSIFVIVASIIAEVTHIITPEVADAAAAVVVSAIILITLVPLFSGLIRTWRELRSIALEINLLSQSIDSDEIKLQIQVI